MADITSTRVQEVENLKATIGWSWTEVSSRLEWGPVGLMRFRQLKAPIEDHWLLYLREVANAVASVPIPGVPMPLADAQSESESVAEVGRQFEALGRNPAESRMRAAGMVPPEERETVEIRAMMMDDIAAKLATEYAAIDHNPEMTGEHRQGAKWVISRLAERLGITEEVRRALEPPAPAPKVDPVPVSRMPDIGRGAPAIGASPWTVPSPPREAGALDTF